VQKTINRIQPFEVVAEVTENTRAAGYTSTSFDLVYGLPHQTKDSIIDTINKVRELKPDRIAYYSYAHVPWIKGNGQRGYDEADLPKDDEKRELYEIGYQLLLDSGYKEIGMDHFALETDNMYVAMKNKELHRNFMGYSASKTQLMIGLGVSSISDSWYAFAQNVKTVEEYYKILEEDQIPIFRGHHLTEEDLVIRKHILEIMCHYETSWANEESYHEIIDECVPRLAELVEDGVLELGNHSLKVTEAGKPFIRNICMAFDVRLIRNKPQTQLFSMTI
jgi:oxygen-independent coproporphyrinogen III oxidase